MIDLNQEVEMTWTKPNQKIYTPKGYKFTNIGDKFQVKLIDLELKSQEKINVICDYCDALHVKRYNDYIRRRKDAIIDKDSCKKCKTLKTRESNLIKYGVEVPNQNKISIEKLSIDFDKRGYVLLSQINNPTEKTRLEYICKKHPETTKSISYGCFKNGVGCTGCMNDNNYYNQKHTYEKVYKDFTDKNYILISKEYVNNKQKLEFVCNVHREKGVQFTTYNNFKNRNGCRYCGIEKRSGENHPCWKGGITPLYEHIRHNLTQWKKDSMRSSNYKCVITNKRFDKIHHLYSFNLILEETFSLLPHIEIKQQIIDYTQQELTELTDKCIELHNKHPLGICLNNEIHELFHFHYGYGNNIPSQFYEFQQKYKNGDYNNYKLEA